MTKDEVLKELVGYANSNTKNTFLKHGAKEPLFGVKVQDLKTILKKTKKDHQLAMALYDTGNSDAMYLAGLMADENQIKKTDLQRWVKKAYWSYLSEYTVPWVASESPFGLELALEWIESKKETISCAGWATFSNLVALKENKDLDLKLIDRLLDRVEKNIHQSQNRVKYTMNGFVISVGGYIASLNKKAKAVAVKIGKVDVHMGGTACKVPSAPEYILKMEARGTLIKKRKMARC